jgi:transcription antitermination protein NusB
MLNRRHLRIKVLQALYAYFQSDEDSFKRVETDLLVSIDRIYDIYLYFLLSFDELREISEQKIVEGKNKIRPTQADLDPNTKFVENKVFRLLSDSRKLRLISEQNKVNWVGVEYHEMFKKIMTQIRESELYFTYMNSETRSFEEDKEFAIALFKQEIANSSLVYHFFEEKSIHWLDDIDLMCSMVVKTIKSLEEDQEADILPLFKDEEDEMYFVKTLLRKCISMDNDNLNLIDELTKNWELDRIAKMDIILMKMAITELQVFNNIPKKVTLNEYIEISKFYSTPKSSSFINGILDKAIFELEKNNKIVKIGRGLA